MKTKFIFQTLLLFGILLTPTTLLHAQDKTGVNLSPFSTEFSTKTEQTYQGSYTLTNSESADFRINFKEGTKSGEELSLSELEWFKLQNSPEILAANSQITINYSITVPKDTEKGVYIKILLAELYSEQLLDSTSVNLAIPFQASIVVDSLFSSQTGVIIKEFEAEKFIFDNNVDLKITIGNADDKGLTKPVGNLNIINPAGRIVYTTVLNESLTSIIADKTYKINTDLPNLGLTDIGQYTAQIQFTDSLSTKSVTKKITFFSFNQLYIVLILVSIVIAILILKLGKGLIKILKANSLEDKEYSLGVKRNNKRQTSK